MLPGFGLEQMMDCSKPGQGLWHFPFNMQPDLPEALITGREARYFEKFWAEAMDPSIIAGYERTIYVDAYCRPGALSAGLGWYRSIFADGDDNCSDAALKLGLPALAIGGGLRAGAYPSQSLRNVCADVETIVIPNCGHWPQNSPPSRFWRSGNSCHVRLESNSMGDFIAYRDAFGIWEA